MCDSPPLRTPARNMLAHVASAHRSSPLLSRHTHKHTKKKNLEVVHPQLWIFDFDASTWTCAEPVEGGGRRGNPSSGTRGGSGGGAGPGAPAVFDHTATLAAGKHIVVVGGVMVGTTLNKQVGFQSKCFCCCCVWARGRNEAETFRWGGCTRSIRGQMVRHLHLPGSC